MGGFPFRDVSPWVERPDDPAAPLDADVTADVVVVGGGYTGLSTALELRAAGIDVAVLEQGFAGSGASGRNAGHLTPTIGKDVPTLLALFGSERAEALVRFADAAVRHTESKIAELGIDCDYVASGNVLAGVHPKQEKRLRAAAEAARSAGAHVRFLERDAMRERRIPPAFLFGIFEECGGTLHPGRYVTGLRRAALDAGVRLFEESPLAALEEGARVVARTSAGSVTADAAVMATNAYTGLTGFKKRAVAPLRVSLFETEALDEQRLDALAWPGREGIYTAHEVLESYRLTVAGTIVGGSKTVGQGYGTELPPAWDPRAFRVIEDAYRQRFPEVGGAKVAHFWGGWIGLTLDFLPMVGTAGAHGNVHYGIGFCGHGVAQATLAGAMLAERVAGRAHEWDTALARREWSWPPEPLRFVGGRLLSGALEAWDRRTDRQIRRLARSG